MIALRSHADVFASDGEMQVDLSGLDHPFKAMGDMFALNGVQCKITAINGDQITYQPDKGCNNGL